MSAVSRQTAPLSKRYELWLVIFLVALLVARLIANAFARTDLVFDEAQYWSWSRDLDFGYFSKPPLIAWLIRGTTTLCGNSEACIRSSPPFLFTIASWFAGRRLGRVRFVDRLPCGTVVAGWSGSGNRGPERRPYLGLLTPLRASEPIGLSSLVRSARKRTYSPRNLAASGPRPPREQVRQMGRRGTAQAQSSKRHYGGRRAKPGKTTWQTYDTRTQIKAARIPSQGHPVLKP
jgi:hypothetical protein